MSLSKPDGKQSFPRHEQNDKPQKEPSNHGMSIESLWTVNVTQSNAVQLSSTTAGSGIDWEQDRPGEAASHHSNDDNDTQETEEEVCIYRGMAEEKLVVKDSKVVKPGESSMTRRWRPISSIASARKKDENIGKSHFSGIDR